MQYLEAISETIEWSLFIFLRKTMVIQVYAPTSNAEEAEVNGSMKTYKIF